MKKIFGGFVSANRTKENGDIIVTTHAIVVLATNKEEALGRAWLSAQKLFDNELCSNYQVNVVEIGKKMLEEFLKDLGDETKLG